MYEEIQGESVELSDIREAFFPKDFVDFCNIMFDVNPENRMRSVAEMRQHPYMQGETYTHEEAVAKLHERHETYLKEQAQSLGALMIDDVQANNTDRQFRGVKEGEIEPILEKFDIEEEYEEIEELFPTIRTEMREIYQYNPSRSALRSFLVKGRVQETFEFLSCVLIKQFGTNVQQDDIELDDDEYIISLEWHSDSEGPE